MVASAGEKHEGKAGPPRGAEIRRSDVSEAHVGTGGGFGNFDRRLDPYFTASRPSLSACISVNHIALSGPWMIRCITVFRVFTG